MISTITTVHEATCQTPCEALGEALGILGPKSEQGDNLCVSTRPSMVEVNRYGGFVWTIVWVAVAQEWVNVRRSAAVNVAAALDLQVTPWGMEDALGYDVPMCVDALEREDARGAAFFAVQVHPEDGVMGACYCLGADVSLASHLAAILVERPMVHPGNFWYAISLAMALDHRLRGKAYLVRMRARLAKETAALVRLATRAPAMASARADARQEWVDALNETGRTVTGLQVNIRRWETWQMRAESNVVDHEDTLRATFREEAR